MTIPGKRVFANLVASVVLIVVLVAAGLAAAAPIIANGSFETATIGTWGNGFVGGPAQGAALISEWGNGATAVANWTFGTSLHGGNLVGTGDTLLGMYLRQDGGVGDYSAYVVPNPSEPVSGICYMGARFPRALPWRQAPIIVKSPLLLWGPY